MHVERLEYTDMYKEFKEQNLSGLIEHLCQKNIFPKGNEEVFFFCLKDCEKIVGVLKLKTKGSESMFNPGFFNWLSFCSINKEYQGKGFSSLLISEMISFMIEFGLDHLLSSGYSEFGYKRLRPALISLTERYKILFKDSNKISF